MLTRSLYAELVRLPERIFWATAVLLLPLSGACAPSVSDKMAVNETGADSGATMDTEDTGSTDSAVVWPGGEIAVRVQLDTSDPITSAVEDQIDWALLEIHHMRSEPTYCGWDLVYDDILSVGVQMGWAAVAEVPKGWTCAHALVMDGIIYNDPETGESYYDVGCGASSSPIYISDGQRVDTTLSIFCARSGVGGQPD